MTINGQSLTKRDIQWRLDATTQITEAVVVTFFGGPERAPKTQRAQFRDFTLTRLQ